jgi:hypothetical protein
MLIKKASLSRNGYYRWRKWLLDSETGLKLARNILVMSLGSGMETRLDISE